MSEVWFNYDEMRLYATNSKIWDEGQGNTWTGNGTDRKMDQIIPTGRNLGIDTTHPIR